MFTFFSFSSKNMFALLRHFSMQIPSGNATIDYAVVGIDQLSAHETNGGGSSSTCEDIGLPSWAQHWIIPWERMIIGDKTLGGGHFGEVRFGGVMIEGELFKAAIKQLKGKQIKPQNYNAITYGRA